MAGIARMYGVALDCPDPSELARFYRDLLGWEITENRPEWVELSGGVGAKLMFQRVPDYRPPDWPGADNPQQLHIDVHVDDPDAAEKQVLELGARKHEHQPSPTDSFRVFLDPVGHPFCLCRE